MVYKLLKKYQDENPEKFNKDFLLSKEEKNVLQAVTDIFKSFEIIDEVKLDSVTLETDESQFGPIKNSHHYFKAIAPSRLDKIHYKLTVTPKENEKNNTVRVTGQKLDEENNESFIKEGDLFIPKLIDGTFYINEGIRYFLVHQIVDNATYGFKNTVSLKSLFMPINLALNTITVTPEFSDELIEIPSFTILMFKKCLSPIYYMLAKLSYDSLESMSVKDPANIIAERLEYKDSSIIDKMNEFLGLDLEFSDKLEDFIGKDDKLVFHICTDKSSGVYFSISKELFENNYLARAVVGTLLEMRTDYSSSSKKKKLIPSYDDIITPFFWIDLTSSFFTKNNDYLIKYNKVRMILVSLDRLVDSATQKVLRIPDDDKKDTLCVIRYIMKNFEDLVKEDSCDLDSKRVRVLEYLLYPLRAFVSNQIFKVINASSRSRAVLARMFSGLNPMYLIKQTVMNELLRYFNSSNDAMTLYSAITKYSLKGPQALSKYVSVEQRDVHPSYTGRISLVASNAATPGLSGTLTPFVELYDGGYFAPLED